MLRLPSRFFLVCGLCLFCGLLQGDEPGRVQVGKVLGETVDRDQIERVGIGTLTDQVQAVFHRPVMKKYLNDHKAELEFTEEELTYAAYALDERLVREHNATLTPEAQRTQAKKTIRSELEEIQDRLASDNLSRESRDMLTQQKAVAEKSLKESRENLRNLLNGMPEFFLTSPKLSRHLYEKYGGGRVLVTKWGLMAFDAYYRWLDERESLGEFEISDPKIRQAVKQARLDDLASWEKQPRRGTSFLSDKQEHIQEVLNPPILPRRKADAKSSK